MEVQNGIITLENDLALSTNAELYVYSATHQFNCWVYTQRKLAHTSTKRFNVRMFVAALFVIAMNRKQPKYPINLVCLYSGMIQNLKMKYGNTQQHE